MQIGQEYACAITETYTYITTFIWFIFATDSYAYKELPILEKTFTIIMDVTGTEDIISKQGSNGLRQAIALTDMMNDFGTKLEKLERELAQLRPKPADTSEQILQIQTRDPEAFEACFFSVPVYTDTLGLGCFKDFADALCRHSNGTYDEACMSMSPCWEAVEQGSRNTLKRPIIYIDGIVGAMSLDCNMVRQSLQNAWTKTTVAELCRNSTSDFEIAGYVQKTSYGNVWADLTAEAIDSGAFHADDDKADCHTRAVWKVVGYPSYDFHPTAWFAEFSTAIVHDKFRLSSKKSRNKLQELLQRLPTPT